jgi:preprotein translocase subunit SecG
MASNEQKIITYKKIRGVVRFLGALTLPLAVTFWIIPNRVPFAVLYSILTLIFITAYLMMSVLIRKNREAIKKAPQPRIGHQGEPGAWRCDCGRYNTAYRSVCLSCGAKKPQRLFD